MKNIKWKGSKQEPISATDFYDEDKTPLENMIAFAKMHIQACKEDIAGSIEYDQDKTLHRQSVLQAYPDSNIR